MLGHIHVLCTISIMLNVTTHLNVLHCFMVLTLKLCSAIFMIYTLISRDTQSSSTLRNLNAFFSLQVNAQ